MNIASIDIGSNTVLLLIASVNENNEFTPIVNKYEMPRISKGLKENGEISNEAVERLLSVLAVYKKIIDEYECEVIIAKATNALRIAVNSKSIIDRVAEIYGIKIDIISGDQEAALSYLGASATLPGVHEKIVLDIGGGSTEIIYGLKEKVIFKKSHPVGAVNTTEQFIKNDPPTLRELNELSATLRDLFKGIKTDIPPGSKGIAVAGTPTSLAAMHQGIREYEENKVEGYFLSLDAINNLIDQLTGLKSNEILNHFGQVVTGRQDVITAGAMIMLEVGKILQTEGFTVSGRGIRYGAVVHYLRKRE